MIRLIEAKCLAKNQPTRHILKPKLNRFKPGLFLNDPNNISEIILYSNVEDDQVCTSSIRFCKSCKYILVVDIVSWVTPTHSFFHALTSHNIFILIVLSSLCPWHAIVRRVHIETSYFRVYIQVIYTFHACVHFFSFPYSFTYSFTEIICPSNHFQKTISRLVIIWKQGKEIGFDIYI